MLKRLRDRLSPVAYQEAQATGGRARGFTLLELLIVIALLAILAVVVILVLNPAETLRRARDSQRISDLSSLKSAIGLYLTDNSSSYDLDGTVTSSTNCEGADDANVSIVFGGDPDGVSSDADINTTQTVIPTTAYTLDTYVTLRSAELAIGTAAWVPVNFADISGGTPLSALPSDPAFSATADDITEGTGNTGDFLYVYGCYNAQFEINANLESTSNTGAGNAEGADGGDEADAYEVGTNLTIITTW